MWYKHVSFLVLLSIIIIPSYADARHNSGVDRDDLDDDIVEGMPIPVLFGIEYDDINPDFGDPRGDGSREHEGEDMIAPKGTPIVSPTEAIVIRTGTGPSAGKYVYTANPGGETFRYMHLDYIADLDRGDELEVGDFIGTVGDTGNAPDGVYHLHFEIRDDDNDPTDPYPRLTEEFALEEKISFLDDVFRDIRDDDEYAEFLIDEFGDELSQGVAAGYDMPRALEEVLEDAGEYLRAKVLRQLMDILSLVPQRVPTELSEGDQGAPVALLQLYLVYLGEGPARDALAAAGATGYYGPVTAAAISEFQASLGVAETGVYDLSTRAAMLEE